MSNKKLDFIVIGAAKSGTTSLHELLKNHPDIHLPEGKEHPFFTDNKMFSKGVDRFIDKLYSDADASKKWGKVTPQYMTGQETVMPKEIASRIKKELPEVKIIAILREPISRSFSYYKMSKRLGYEKRSFNNAIQESLTPAELEKSRERRDWTKVYVTPGEYGRILSYYYDLFDEKQILVLFTDELRDKPESVINKICNFIGINETSLPEIKESNFHKGGSKPKIKLLTPGVLYKVPFVKYVWLNILPLNFRRKLSSKLEHWNIQQDNESPSLEDSTKASLTEHYKSDVKVLEKLIGQKVPWQQYK